MAKRKRTEKELNFPVEAQDVFDALCAVETWTWSGIAKAFSDRFNASDMSELKYFVDAECRKIKI